MFAKFDFEFGIVEYRRRLLEEAILRFRTTVLVSFLKMASLPKSKNVVRRRNGVVTEASSNSNESSLQLNQHLEFSPEVAAMMASYHGSPATADATSDQQMEMAISGDLLLAKSHFHLSPTSSSTKAQFDRLQSATLSLEPTFSGLQKSIASIPGQSNDDTNDSKTAESPLPLDSSATLNKSDTAPSVDSFPSYWAYTGSSFSRSQRPLASSISHGGSLPSGQTQANQETPNKPIPCGPLNAWYLIKGGM